MVSWRVSTWILNFSAVLGIDRAYSLLSSSLNPSGIWGCGIQICPWESETPIRRFINCSIGSTATGQRIRYCDCQFCFYSWTRLKKKPFKEVEACTQDLLGLLKIAQLVVLRQSIYIIEENKADYVIEPLEAIKVTLWFTTQGHSLDGCWVYRHMASNWSKTWQKMAVSYGRTITKPSQLTNLRLPWKTFENCQRGLSKKHYNSSRTYF